MFKKFGMSAIALLCALLPFNTMVAAVTTPVNLIANPSMEMAAADGTPVGWHSGGWGANAGASPYETTGHTGARSLKTAITSYTDGDAKWYFDNIAVTPGTNYEYSNWYMSDVDTEIDAEVTFSDGTPVGYYALGTVSASPTTWTKADAQFIAPANAASVTFYQVLNKVGYVQIDDASLNVFTPNPFTEGMVSLTFDDGWRNQSTTGLPLLDKYGMKATFYSLTNTFDFPDYMDTLMTKGLQTDGQEVASHTVSHPSLPTLTDAALTQELSESKATLQGLLGPTAAINFASPYGEYNDAVIAKIKLYYRSHRSTDEGFNSKDNFNIYNIKVQNILDATTPAQVAAWVAQAKADHTWLVLVFHQVQADPSAIEDYSVTPANLDAELAGIQQSGIAVKTVNQALDAIEAQLGTTTPPVVKPGDVNGDGTVDALDLSTLLANWNKTAATFAQGDLNADGTVDALDLSTLLINWSK